LVPDGQWVAFFADGKLKKVALMAVSPRRLPLCLDFQEASWGSAGVIIFRSSNRQPLSRISASGGMPARSRS
jgi:hypothetical protein